MEVVLKISSKLQMSVMLVMMVIGKNNDVSRVLVVVRVYAN